MSAKNVESKQSRFKDVSIFTEDTLNYSRIGGGHNQGVGAGVEIGHVHVNFLVLDPRHGCDLGHEENEVACVDGEGQAVNDEEEVRPVLCRPGI